MPRPEGVTPPPEIQATKPPDEKKEKNNEGKTTTELMDRLITEADNKINSVLHNARNLDIQPFKGMLETRYQERASLIQIKTILEENGQLTLSGSFAENFPKSVLDLLDQQTRLIRNMSEVYQLRELAKANSKPKT